MAEKEAEEEKATTATATAKEEVRARSWVFQRGTQVQRDQCSAPHPPPNGVKPLGGGSHLKPNNVGTTQAACRATSFLPLPPRGGARTGGVDRSGHHGQRSNTI